MLFCATVDTKFGKRILRLYKNRNFIALSIKTCITTNMLVFMGVKIGK
jgi:hypothetical protein